jgi:hypothetical protein
MSRVIHFDNEGLPLCNGHTRWRTPCTTTTVESDVTCWRCHRKLLYVKPPTRLRCSICKRTKPVSEFSRTRFHTRGYSYNCKLCAKTVYENREQLNASHKAWVQRNPQKAKAVQMAKKVPRKGACERCGSTDRLHRHHPDYSKPLEVVTLCVPCHEGVHHGYQ